MLKAVVAKLEREMGSTVIEEEDYVDDGSIIHLKLNIDVENGEATFDFEGTSSEVYGNWNAPQAVTAAAIIYCLCCLVDVGIPLNQGCLAPATIQFPDGIEKPDFDKEDELLGLSKGWDGSGTERFEALKIGCDNSLDTKDWTMLDC